MITYAKTDRSYLDIGQDSTGIKKAMKSFIYPQLFVSFLF